jgi:hypothetical protein
LTLALAAIVRGIGALFSGSAAPEPKDFVGAAETVVAAAVGGAATATIGAGVGATRPVVANDVKKPSTFAASFIGGGEGVELSCEVGERCGVGAAIVRSSAAELALDGSGEAATGICFVSKAPGPDETIAAALTGRVAGFIEGPLVKTLDGAAVAMVDGAAAEAVDGAPAATLDWAPFATLDGAAVATLDGTLVATLAWAAVAALAAGVCARKADVPKDESNASTFVVSFVAAGAGLVSALEVAARWVAEAAVVVSPCSAGFVALC